MKAWHLLLCVGFIAAAAVLVAVGADAIAIVPFIGCAVMMGAMVWMMMKGGRHS
jgi:hypothetical protein